MRRTNNLLPKLVATALLLGGLVMQCIGAWQDSQTIDEAVHLSAGVSYWQTGDFRLNPEHPPLIKLLAGLPVLAVPGWSLPLDDPSWKNRDEWRFGTTWLYPPSSDSITSSRQILLIGRWPMILLWAALAILIYVTATRWWSAWAGVLALSFFVFDPNFLGHGHLVTTDIGFSLFFLATVLAGRRFFLQPTWSNLLWLCVWFAVAQLSKYSALILWPTMIFLAVLAHWYHPKKFTGRWVARFIVSLIAFTSLSIWLVYGGEVLRINQDPRIDRLWQERVEYIAGTPLADRPAWINTVLTMTDRTSAWYPRLKQWENLSVPAYSYWRGLFSLISHGLWGHGAFLLGQSSSSGWWYYFPLAILVKTPWLTLMLFMTAIVVWLKKLRLERHRPQFSFWLIALPPLIYFLWSLASSINIGLRHIFPIFPFIFLAIGSLVLIGQKNRWVGWSLASSVVAIVLIASLAWPNTIGYFQGLAGGTERGHRLLLDSNLDWSQDIWRTKKFFQDHGVARPYMAIFGNMPLERIIPGVRDIPNDREYTAGIRPRGIVAISRGRLYDPSGDITWLRELSPDWRVGSSILVYDLRE